LIPVKDQFVLERCNGAMDEIGPGTAGSGKRRNDQREQR